MLDLSCLQSGCFYPVAEVEGIILNGKKPLFNTEPIFQDLPSQYYTVGDLL